jgi:hypothetical protein
MKGQDLLPGWESEFVLLHYVQPDPPSHPLLPVSFLGIMRQVINVVK